jgi:flagellar protein FliL
MRPEGEPPVSTAAAVADAGAPKKGKKKLIIMLVAALVVAGGGGAAVLMMKKKAQAQAEAEAADEDGEHAPAQAAASKRDPKAVPTFVPLDPFTVNLADREAERYVQVGITLEVADAKIGEQIKNYMPAIRNNILLALADKTAAQLMERDGKTRLAEQVRRETSRAMGYDVAEPDEDEETGDKPAKKKKKKKAEAPLPVSAVHFSNFIIQ